MKQNSRVIIFLAILAFSSHSVRAAWGDFDTTFGFLGASIDPVTNHYPAGVAVQTDGKILVTGYRLVSGKKRFFLRRYLSNGQLDTSFGSNGSAVPTALIIVDADYYGSEIVVQSNGRIAVSGRGNDRPTIWRFLSSGSPDTSIGAGGMRTLSAYASVTPQLATFSNILYVGVRKSSPASTVVLKYNSNGTRDMSFGGSGEAVTGASSYFSLATDPVSGNILIGGISNAAYTSHGVQRLLTTGTVDTTFNSWTATFGTPEGYTSDFIRLANGQFVVNERRLNLGQGGVLLSSNIVRLSSNGSLTSSTEYEPNEFLNMYDFNGPCPDVIAQQQDGRVVMKGRHWDEIFRWSSNFSTVQSMDCDAYVTLDFPATNAVLQSDDKMIAAGRYNGYITLIRTLP